MAEILQSSLRASLSFTNFQALLPKPSRFCSLRPSTPKFAPLRSPRPPRTTAFRILAAKSDSDSGSSSSDLALISSAARSDGSVVFRFGTAEEIEALAALKRAEDIKKAEEKAAATESSMSGKDERFDERVESGSKQVVTSRSETRRRGRETQVSGEGKRDLDGDSSVSVLVLESKGDSLEGEEVVPEAIGSYIDHERVGGNEVRTDSISSELGSVSRVTSTSSEALAETNTSIETLTETSLDRTETSEQLFRAASPTNVIEFETSEDKINNAEELPIPGAMELDSIEETPKSEESSTEEFVLCSGAALLQHDSEGLTAGKDAYFVASQNWLGVADGVGQWSLEGVSAGLYAHELMENCKRIVSDCEGVPLTSNPDEVLIRSVAETESTGSSTILVANFDGQAFRVANIGDSGFVIIRAGYVFHQSSPTVHEFNFPLHVERGDDPSELIQAYKIDLDEGDVIVTATDGLFDNLYDQEVASFVSSSLKAGLEPQDVAKALASKAQEVARSSTSRTPFSDAAKAAGYGGYSGGKLDAVAVIVSIVQKKPSS